MHTGTMIRLSQTDEPFVGTDPDEYPGHRLQYDGADIGDLHRRSQPPPESIRLISS